MSGHSKWSTIKRQKGIADSRRSAVFTKLGRQITVAARLGGGDPVMNFRLRLAIDTAKAANLPNDNIERAIKAGTGEGKDSLTKEVLYEGFGPGGVAVMVEAITDNSNRTTAEVRNVFTKHGGSMGSHNSVGWMFALRGVTKIPAAMEHQALEDLELQLIDAGADDVQEEGDLLIVLSPPEKVPAVRGMLEKITATVESAVEYVPTTTVDVDDSAREKLHILLEALDELDDVTRVTSNEN